ncbi:MAG: hypothetical protein ABH864_00145 [archaeon]
MTNQSTEILEREELSLLREHMLRPEELFLLQYLKTANRAAAWKLQEVYGWDSSSFADE